MQRAVATESGKNLQTIIIRHQDPPQTTARPSLAILVFIFENLIRYRSENNLSGSLK